MLEWADIVFVMDDEQIEALGKMFPGDPELYKVVCLNIKDDYHFLDPELVSILQQRTQPHFDRLRTANREL